MGDMKEAMEVEKHVADIQKEEGVSPELLELYRTVFGILDLDGGKTIEAEELSIGLAQVGYDLEDHEINQMLSEVDDDGSGEIDFAEFLQFMLKVSRGRVSNDAAKCTAEPAAAVTSLEPPGDESKQPHDLQPTELELLGVSGSPLLGVGTPVRTSNDSAPLRDGVP